jgi:Spy/CpxP family protein refolding chaperone
MDMEVNMLKKSIFNFTVRLMTVIVLTVMLTSSIFAQRGMFGSRGRGMRGARSMRGPGIAMLYQVLKNHQEELKITDQQLGDIKKQVLRIEENHLKLKNSISEQQLQLKKLMMEETRDYKKMKSILSRISEFRNQLVISGFETRDAIKKILTPEQQEALQNMRRQRTGNKFRRFPRNRRQPGQRMRRFMDPLPEDNFNEAETPLNQT